MERAIYCTRVHLPELIKNYKYKGQDGKSIINLSVSLYVIFSR